MHILLHAPTPGALTRARSNARNLRAARPDARIEIVVNAGGVDAALDQPEPQTDPLLLLCQNSLKSRGIGAGDLATVPAGIVHIAQRQAEGWIYVRA